MDYKIKSLWDQIRNKRNLLLSQSDWTQLIDAPLSASEKQEWRVYRQQLRDLPKSIPEINVLDQEVIFPKKPE